VITRSEHFYAKLLSPWGKTYGLKAICEHITHHLIHEFEITSLNLIVVHQSHWAVLMHQSGDTQKYQYPPIELTDDVLPFYQINKATRNNEPYIIQLPHSKRICLPLERHNRIIGCLILDLPTQIQCPLTFFLPLTTLLATELESGLMSETIQFEHSSRRNAEHALHKSLDEQDRLLTALRSIHHISFLLWRSQNLDQILFTAVDQGKKQLNIDRMAIFLFDDNKDILGTYGTDIHGSTIDESYFRSQLHEHWFTSQTLINKDYLVVQENSDLFQDCQSIGKGWSAYVALWEEDTPIGWIACDNLISRKPFEPHNHEILKQFAFTVSQHIMRCRAEENLKQLNKNLESRVQSRTLELEKLNQKLKKLSQTDPLTKIANRRVFDKLYKLEWQRIQTQQQPLSMLLIDVDFFKNYNDEYGHASGDTCLKIIAQTLDKMPKNMNHLFARFGGEEFVLLLSNTDHDACQKSAKQALIAIQNLKLPHRKGVKNTNNCVSISIGASTYFPTSKGNMKSFFRFVDDALYQAKNNGRNQYHFKSYVYDCASTV
jgi:diguanylate cyclase (GGDEF)-like protein